MYQKCTFRKFENLKFLVYPLLCKDKLHRIYFSLSIEVLQNGVRSYEQFLQIWHHLRYLNQNCTSWTSLENMTFHKVWMLWLQKWACHALENFKIVLAGNPFWMHPKTSNLVKSCYLMRLITDKNLVMISQFSFE